MDLVDRVEALYEVLSLSADIVEEDGEIWLHQEWDGLPDMRDNTWGRLNDFNGDVHELVHTLLAEAGKTDLACRAASQLGIHI